MQCTHALVLKLTLPPAGSAAGTLAPVAVKRVPLASASAPEGTPRWSATKEAPPGVEEPARGAKEATPSVCVPEMKKAVSAGPGMSVAKGRHPADGETITVPATHGEQKPPPKE